MFYLPEIRQLSIYSALVCCVVASALTMRAPLAQGIEEQCALGTGIPSEDVLVCNRALLGAMLPPVGVATLRAARGQALRLIGEPRRALKDFDAALLGNPHSAQAYLGRAQTRLDLSERAAAEADLHAALELFPRFGAALRTLGRLHFLNGDDEKARRVLGSAIEQEPGNSEVHAFLGLVHFRQAEFRQALAAFRRAHVLGLDYVYLPLWEWLAARHAGSPSDAGIALLHDDLEPGEWPRPLLGAFLTRVDGEQVLQQLQQGRSSDGADARSGDRRIAETAFYLAQLYRLNGDDASAKRQTTLSGELSAPGSVERSMIQFAGGRVDMVKH